MLSRSVRRLTTSHDLKQKMTEGNSGMMTAFIGGGALGALSYAYFTYKEDENPIKDRLEKRG